MADSQYPGQKEGTKHNFSILDFRNKIGDLARPNLFQVEINFPDFGDDAPETGGGGGQGDTESAASGASQQSGVEALQASTFLVKAANIPASTIGVIEVPYRGRTMKIAGDRTYEPWTVTVLNSQDFKYRTKFEQWSSKIQSLAQNIQSVDSIAEYQAFATVRQYDRQGGIVRSYRFEGIWPSSVSSIDLAWDSNDTPEEYTVEFQVQYWTYTDDTNAGNGE
jgi:hypothetical protein